MYSLIGTAKLYGMNPEGYLQHVPQRIADHPINRLKEPLRGARAIISNGRLRKFSIVDKKPPQTPQMKGFQAYLDGKTSPKKRWRSGRRTLPQGSSSTFRN